MAPSEAGMGRLPNAPTIALLPDGVEIPPGLSDLPAFRAWAHSDAFPDKGRIDWIGGRIEVDMSPEDLYTHGSPKTALATFLSQEIYVPRRGLVFIDSTRISSPPANLSAEPDIVVVLEETLRGGHARLIPSKSGGPERFVEIEGAVDLIVECVSDSSARKDFQRLRELYHRAGVPEYWLSDTRREEIDFHILLREDAGYARSPRDEEGFAHSTLLGGPVRLVRFRSETGLVFYRLERRS